MDVHVILEQLIQERDQLNESILSLQRLQAGRGRRRGRPPAWLKGTTNKNSGAAIVDKTKRRGRPVGTKKWETEKSTEPVA